MTDQEFKCPFDNLEQLREFVEKHKLQKSGSMFKVFSLKGIFYKKNDKGYLEKLLTNWAIQIEYLNTIIIVYLAFDIETIKLETLDIKILKTVDITWTNYELKNSPHELMYLGNTNLDIEEILIIGKSLVRTIEYQNQNQIYFKSNEFTNTLIDLIVLRIDYKIKGYPFNTNSEAKIVLFGEETDTFIHRNHKFLIKKDLINDLINDSPNSLENLTRDYVVIQKDIKSKFNYCLIS